MKDVIIEVGPGYAAAARAEAARDAAQEDATQTAADRVQTGLDRAQTGLDRVATAADRVQTGLDRTAAANSAAAAAADRVQTGLDRTAAAASATQAGGYRDEAAVLAAAAGTPIYNSSADLPSSPVPANGTWGRVQTANGMQAWQVVSGTWTLIGWITRPQFDSVTELLDSTYTTFGGEGAQVQAGPYYYTQAASGATDQHVTTDGGVKLKVIPIFAGADGGIYPADAYASAGNVAAACAHAAANGGGRVVAPGQYEVSEPIILSSRVVIDMVHSGIIEMTDDDAEIIDCTGSGSVTSRIGVVNGRLKYTNAQTSVAGSAIALAKAGKTTLNWTFDNLAVENAWHWLYVPAGANTFLGRIGQVTAVNAQDYATYFGGGASVHTHIKIDQLWAYCTPGSEPAGAKGHYLANIQELDAGSLLADNIEGIGVRFETCTGRVGTIALESCERSISAAVGGWIYFLNSNLDIGQVFSTGNTLALSGSGSFGFLYFDVGARVRIGSIIDNDLALTDTSSGSYYAAYFADANSRLWNDTVEAGGTSPAASTNDTGDNATKRARRWNGVHQTLDLDGLTVTTKDGAPSTTTMAEFSLVIEQDPSANGEMLGYRRVGSDWVPLLKATTATTAEIEDITNALNTSGKYEGRQVFNTDTNKPVWAGGSAASNVWRDATGTTAHTPT